MAILKRPLQHGAPLWSAARVVYLALLGAYWVWNLVHLAVDMRALAEVRHFCNHRLGLSERAVQTVSWPHVARRIVEVQCPLSPPTPHPRGAQACKGAPLLNSRLRVQFHANACAS